MVALAEPFACAGIDDLDAATLGHVLSFLSPEACCALACVRPAWRAIVDSSPIWQRLCSKRYGISEPVGPGTCPADPLQQMTTFKHAFVAWERRFAAYTQGEGGEERLVLRTWACWGILERWTAENIPAVHRSLNPGATEEALAEAEAELGLTLPPAFRLLYSLHDGQAPVDHDDNSSFFRGLLGSYRFYQHIVSVRLLSLQEVVHWTLQCRDHLLGVSPPGSYVADGALQCTGMISTRESVVLVAASHHLQKAFFIDTDTGDVYVIMQRSLVRAAPAGGEGQRDGLLRWLEGYAANMAAGKYSCHQLIPDKKFDTTTISLYPRCGEDSSVCVTRGVKVEAGAILVPELCHQGSRYFSYSIRFSMLSEEEQLELEPDAQPLTSAQLLTRHWLITDARNHTDEVSGEAVVGLYPLLTPGCAPVIYQSCTNMEPVPGRMRGDFRFVEGTIKEPTGPEFVVECGEFRLLVPEIIF